MIKESKILLTGFEGRSVSADEVITLPVMAGAPPRCIRVHLTFTVVKVSSAYNAIIGRPGLSTLRAIVSIPCLKLKFSMPNGVGQLCEDQTIAR